MILERYHSANELSSVLYPRHGTFPESVLDNDSTEVRGEKLKAYTHPLFLSASLGAV